jgi:hypothetical protein
MSKFFIALVIATIGICSLTNCQSQPVASLDESGALIPADQWVINGNNLAVSGVDTLLQATVEASRETFLNSEPSLRLLKLSGTFAPAARVSGMEVLVNKQPYLARLSTLNPTPTSSRMFAVSELQNIPLANEETEVQFIPANYEKIPAIKLLKEPFIQHPSNGLSISKSSSLVIRWDTPIAEGAIGLIQFGALGTSGPSIFKILKPGMQSVEITPTELQRLAQSAIIRLEVKRGQLFHNGKTLAVSRTSTSIGVTLVQ